MKLALSTISAGERPQAPLPYAGAPFIGKQTDNDIGI